MPQIYYSINGNDDVEDIRSIEKEYTIEEYEKKSLSLQFLAQDITEAEYEKQSLSSTDYEFEIAIWNSEQTEIVYKYLGFVRFSPYFTVRKIK